MDDLGGRPLWTIWVGAMPAGPPPRRKGIKHREPNNLKKNLHKIYVITMYKFKTWQIDLDKGQHLQCWQCAAHARYVGVHLRY